MRCIGKTAKGERCLKDAKIDTTCVAHWKQFMRNGIRELFKQFLAEELGGDKDGQTQKETQRATSPTSH